MGTTWLNKYSLLIRSNKDRKTQSKKTVFITSCLHKAELPQLSVLNFISLKEFYLLGYKAMYSVKIQPTFRRKMSPPYSESENNLSHLLSLVSCSAYSSTLKIEMQCSSETSVDF
jgi:hypothetical protein